MDDPAAPDWHLVVPIKGGAGAKSRLRPPDGVARGALAEAMAQDCVAAAARGMPVGRLSVVTRDERVSRWAKALGALVVADPGGGLDAAVVAAVRMVDGAAPVAVLLGDLPALTAEDLVAALVAAQEHHRAVVPDAEGTGTVLLTTLQARCLEPRFGAGSARRHQDGGHRRLDLDLPRLRTDVDDDGDLAAARALGMGARTRALLRRR